MGSLLVTHPAHFVRGPDGGVYALDTMLDYAFWTRYLAVFDQVGVAARVRPVHQLPELCARADGPRVEFCDLPDYVGPWQYARCRGRLKALLRQAITRYDAHCFRVPCAIATLACRELQRRRLPFALEVTGDPWDSLSAGAVKSLVRPIARTAAAQALRRECRDAAATSYVTKDALQRRYPPSADTYTTHYSSIELPPEAVANDPRADFSDAHRIVFVGTLAVLYKAPDVLIQALGLVRRLGVVLTIVGDGRERPALEALAASCGMADRVTFAGRLPAGEQVRKMLDSADLFVLPSRQEGLPRAMVEAMARGLPCIGSTAGGIPELLAPEDLVSPGDAGALAAKIIELLGDPGRMRRASRDNLERSREYLAPVLAERRKQFYEQVRRVCEAARGGCAV